jgi:hypothetical protein
MFGIYTIQYWCVFPVNNPLDAGEWFEIDDALEFKSDNLDEVISYMTSNYSDKIYRRSYHGSGNECYLCYIVDEDGCVVGYLDFDRTVHILNSKGDDVLDKT